MWPLKMPLPSRQHQLLQKNPIPLTGDMDDITFWIVTKQAPCLHNFNNVMKKADSPTPKTVPSVLETPMKKQELALIDGQSTLTETQQNVYFDTSQSKNRQNIVGSCKSNSVSSDLNFNIKNSSIQNKAKPRKSLSVHKKTELITPTPEVAGTLRRSLRNVHKHTINGHHNSSIEALNCQLNYSQRNNTASHTVTSANMNKIEKIGPGDQTSLIKMCDNVLANKQEGKLNNGQFDDISDMSGFTATYVRSTKLHSSRNIKSLRSKGSRNLLKEAQQSSKNDNSLIVCVNKSLNTGTEKPPLMNCSTDSSQNNINLITVKNNDLPLRVSKSTSLLKFMAAKSSKKTLTRNKRDDSYLTSNNNMNVSFLSKSSNSTRYPKRQRNSSAEDIHGKCVHNEQQKRLSLHKRRATETNTGFNNSERKENPNDKLVTHTRSSECIGQSSQITETSVEPGSSVATVNVATIHNNAQSRNYSTRRNNDTKDSRKQNSSGRKESHREKSVAICFSDSDDDNLAYKQRKFFC